VVSKVSTVGDAHPKPQPVPTPKTGNSPNSFSLSAVRIGQQGSFLQDVSPRKSRFSGQQVTVLASASQVTTPSVRRDLKKQSSFGASFSTAKQPRSTSITAKQPSSPRPTPNPKPQSPTLLPALHRKASTQRSDSSRPLGAQPAKR